MTGAEPRLRVGRRGLFLFGWCLVGCAQTHLFDKHPWKNEVGLRFVLPVGFKGGMVRIDEDPAVPLVMGKTYAVVVKGLSVRVPKGFLKPVFYYVVDVRDARGKFLSKEGDPPKGTIGVRGYVTAAGNGPPATFFDISDGRGSRRPPL